MEEKKNQKVEKIIIIILVESLLAALYFVVRENVRLKAREEAVIQIVAEEVSKKYAEIDEQNNKLTEEIECGLEVRELILRKVTDPTADIENKNL